MEFAVFKGVIASIVAATTVATAFGCAMGVLEPKHDAVNIKMKILAASILRVFIIYIS